MNQDERRWEQLQDKIAKGKPLSPYEERQYQRLRTKLIQHEANVQV